MPLSTVKDGSNPPSAAIFLSEVKRHMELDKIFLGNTPASQRLFLLEALKDVRRKGYKKVIVPACGQFAVVRLALNAGYKPENITSSDISFFSTVLGYWYSDQPIDSIEFTVGEEFKADYDSMPDEVSKASFLFWLMKVSQLHPHNNYENAYHEHYRSRMSVYVEKIKVKLLEYKEIYKGIKYEIADMRDVLDDANKHGGVLVVNPPAYKKGYEKMFDFGENIVYNPNVEEFDWNEEYFRLYEHTKEGKSIAFWYRYKDSSEFNQAEVVFGREYTPERMDCWLCTNPEKLDESLRNVFDGKKIKQPRGRFKIVPEDYEFTDESKVTYKRCDEDTALYYRDLFAHKMGATKAEGYYLLFIDGMLFGVTGFHLGELRRLQSTTIFEVFGFNAQLKNYENANRLLMMVIMSREFMDYVKDCAKTNRFFDIERFKTTCISKYRKVKVNNGLLEIVKREKMDNESYKILYMADIREKTVDETLKEYLGELANV